MGEANGNPLSLAKRRGEQIVKVADLGDGYALAGVGLTTAFDAERENLCVLLVVNAGRNSALVGLQVVQTVIAEVGRISLADLKTSIAAALDGPKEEIAQ